jgi:hypothetical protein
MLKKGNGGVIEPHPAWIAHAKVAKDAKPRQECGAGTGLTENLVR